MSEITLQREVHDEVGCYPSICVPIFEKDESSGPGFIGGDIGLGRCWLSRRGFAFRPGTGRHTYVLGRPKIKMVRLWPAREGSELRDRSLVLRRVSWVRCFVFGIILARVGFGSEHGQIERGPGSGLRGSRTPLCIR